MQNFEKLGLFHLGRRFDLETRTTLDEPVLYESRDLVTHAVCIRMTGSGKTGADAKRRIGVTDDVLAAARRRFATRREALADRLRRAGLVIAREGGQVSQQKMQTAVSFGATVLGALLGRKNVSTGAIAPKRGQVAVQFVALGWLPASGR